MSDSEHLRKYEERMNEYKSFLRSRKGGKHTIVLDAIYSPSNEDNGEIGRVNLDIVKKYCEKMDKRKKDVDFEFIVLIRLVFLLEEIYQAHLHKSEASVTTKEPEGSKDDLSKEAANDQEVNSDGQDRVESHPEGVSTTAAPRNESVESNATGQTFNMDIASGVASIADMNDPEQETSRQSMRIHETNDQTTSNQTLADYYRDVNTAIEMIVKSFKDFPFWPHKHTSTEQNWSHMSEQVRLSRDSGGINSI